jgi:ACS family hexuronate transporter-like MFS transporter
LVEGCGVNLRQDEPQLARRGKWIAISFAFLATVINYLDRQTLSVMAPVLLVKFHISAERYSHIIFAFMLAYTIMNGTAGLLLDRLGTKLGYGLTIAFWSAMEILHAFSKGALSLGVFRFLLGIGEAGNYPAGVKLIAEWFPADERSLASGIFNSGASIGAILAPPLIAFTALAMGWQAGFVIVGLLGFLWLIAWAIFYRAPLIAPRKEEPQHTVPFRVLIHSKFLWRFTLSKVLSDPVWYFYTFWIPQYLRSAHGFSLRQIGETAWIPFMSAAIGNIAGGAVFMVLLHFKIASATARRIAILLFSMLMACAVFVGNGSATECIVLISLAAFGYSGMLANLLALPGDVFPATAVASLWGFASMGSGLGGMIFALITGWMIDRYTYQPVFILFGIIPLVAAWLVWTLPRKEDLEFHPSGGSPVT